MLAQIADPRLVDECVIGNFMAARFNHQGHLAALMPSSTRRSPYKPEHARRGRVRLGRARGDDGA